MKLFAPRYAVPEAYRAPIPKGRDTGRMRAENRTFVHYPLRSWAKANQQATRVCFHSKLSVAHRLVTDRLFLGTLTPSP